jgi:hypothetical protein
MKRGIGRLLIGDEYDTTLRENYQGIPHYAGLYDQSRYFDDAMSNYFLGKKWGIRQFSILRPMSEFLIQTMLAKRYPELLKLQVSCHAAHIENGCVYPCGKCEKCRRIMSMLVAQRLNPGDCGYSSRQINDGLEAMAARGIHQENEGAQQVAFMLHSQGKISTATSGALKAEPHPEVLKLRFDAERSPFHEIPVDLRRALYQIMLQHAHTALKRTGSGWTDFDVMQDEAMDESFSFDPKSASMNEEFVHSPV